MATSSGDEASSPAPDGAYRDSPGLRCGLVDGVLRLTLDRPDRRNALDDAVVAALIDAIDAAGRDVKRAPAGS